MPRNSRVRVLLALLISAIITSAACAGFGGLQQIIRPPRFEQATGQRAEIRLLGPSTRSPLGGAGVRIWLQITNPNPFGFTLSTIDADLILEGNHAATGNFPLGLPLTAGQETVVPLDLSISFADVPALSRSIGRLATGGTASYQLDGTVGIEAGRFGKPTFGPMTLTTGQLQVR
ncbi:MAG TPA: LEA type 2 family protein [Vicinamibacterales bacterium]|nr:LEA type 2 family protein [Vicinamibacterales bacterium]